LGSYPSDVTEWAQQERSRTKIFITGAAGYVGGSIAKKLTESGHEVTGLARSGEQVSPLKARGIAPVVGTLDDPEILTKAAQAADAVINAASADHAGSVFTLVTSSHSVSEPRPWLEAVLG
jgi:uncharacterized protein YbjT (DUF2867 family)